MNAAILTIGDELLIGQVVNTNAAWLGKELTRLGFDVKIMVAIGDKAEEIEDGLQICEKRADLIVVSGGLGPTQDDITRETLAEYFGKKLVYHKDVEEHIKKLFARMNYPFTDNNKSQAMVPEGTKILWNFYGTAPGMWLEKDGKIFVFLPGVPFEMKNIFTEYLKPELEKRFNLPKLVMKTVSVYGIGESLLAHRLQEWEKQLPGKIKLAYLPSPKRIRLRLQIKTHDIEKAEKLIDEQIKKLEKYIPDLTITIETEDLAPVVHRVFKNKGLTLSVAESCTGGNVMGGLVMIPGASKFLKGGMVTYATETKISALGVPREIIKKYSVVSEEVAKEMARRVRKIFKTDIAISVTGNAGPEKGDSDKEVGTCIIGVATEYQVEAHTYLFGQPREKAILRSISKAYEWAINKAEELK